MITQAEQNKDNVLDVARLVACLSVMLFHFYSRHLDGLTVYPYGDQYNVFIYGYMGVQFFLMLSGFLIIPSLERTESFLQFVKKKFVRLWMPLLICSIVTFVFVLLFDTDNIFPESHKFSNFLFSLTFISPFWGSLVLSKSVTYINGSYWFMGIEVIFLLACSIIYFANKKHGIRNILMVSVVFHVFHLVTYYCGHRLIINYFCNNKFGIPFSAESMSTLSECLDNWVYPQYSLYCVFGIVLYLIMQHGMTSKNVVALGSVLMLYVCQCFVIPASRLLEPWIVLAIALLFGLYIYYRRKAPSADTDNKPKEWLARLGKTTYTSYLIHETIGVIILHHLAGNMGGYAWGLPIILICCALTYGYISYHFIENPIIKLVNRK